MSASTSIINVKIMTLRKKIQHYMYIKIGKNTCFDVHVQFVT